LTSTSAIGQQQRGISETARFGQVCVSADCHVPGQEKLVNDATRRLRPTGFCQLDVYALLSGFGFGLVVHTALGELCIESPFMTVNEAVVTWWFEEANLLSARKCIT